MIQDEERRPGVGTEAADEDQAKSLDIKIPHLASRGWGEADSEDTKPQRFRSALCGLGVPIFTAPRRIDGADRRVEFGRPHGWQELTADGNESRISRWRPGDAICAVTGGVLVVVDVDPRNDGDVTAVLTLLAELSVRIFARVATPGRGAHFYVAGHPELSTAHQLIGLPGVELLSFGANVFLPGTQRPKYDGHGYDVIFDDLDALADGGDPDGAEQLAGWVGGHRAPTSDFIASPPWDGAASNKRQRAYLDGVLGSECEQLARLTSGRNHALFLAALKCGSYIAGAGMDKDEVVRRLAEAAATCGYTAKDGTSAVGATIRSGLRDGQQKPRAVPGPDVDVSDPGSAPVGCSAAVITAAEQTRATYPQLDLGHVLRADRPRRQWVVEGLVPEGGSVSIVAPAGHGKSLLALAIALHVADGRGNFAGLPIPRRRRVLYIDCENTEDDLAERFSAFGVHEPMRDLVMLHLPALPGLDTIEGGRELSAILDAYEISDGDVVIFDSTQRVLVGKENDADTIRDFYRHTGQQLKRRRVAVLRLDNPGQDQRRGARGTTGKRDDVDIEFQMTAKGGTITLAVSKQRIPDINPLTLTKAVDEDGRVSYSSDEDPIRAQVRRALGDVVRLNVPVGASQRAAQAALPGHSRAAVRQALKERE